MDDRALPTTTDLPRSFDAISPTALLTAHGRRFSNIEFAEEMCRELERHGPVDALGASQYLATRLETRHILVDELLRRTDHPQVLEVAAGYDTRGMSWALRHLGRYVELDRKPVSTMKQSIVEKIQPDGISNLHFVSGDALNSDDLNRAAALMHPHHEIAVIAEGLMMYLSPDERAQLASHMRALLLQRGGTWITPDIVLREMLDDPFVTPRGKMEQVRDVTQSDLYGHAYSTVDEAQQFFWDLGFTVDVFPFSIAEVALTSRARLGLSQDDVHRANQYSNAFVLTARP